MRPARAITSATPLFTAASSRTSIVSHESRMPAGRASGARRLAPKTRKPRAARSSAVARPMPDDAPVTSTICGSVTDLMI